MKPVVFAGPIPSHLLSPDASRLKEQQFAAQAAENQATARERLTQQIALLRGNLAEQETSDIVAAMSAVCDAAEPGIAEDEVVRLTLRAIRHLAEECDQPVTCHPSRHWVQWDFDIVHKLSILRVGERPTCRNALTELQFQVLQNGMCERKSHRIEASHLIRALEKVAMVLRTAADPRADYFDQRLIICAPTHVPARIAPWLASDGQEAPLRNTESFMQKAWPLMNEEQRSRYADTCHLDWLPEAYAVKSLVSEPNEARCKAYSKGTPRLLSQAIQGFLNPAGARGSESEFGVAWGVGSVPAWKELANDLPSLRVALKTDWLIRDSKGVRDIAETRLSFMLHLMNKHVPPAVRTALIDDMWRTATDAVVSAPTRGLAIKQALVALRLMGRLSFVDGATETIRKHFLGMNLLENKRLCPNGHPLLDVKLGCLADSEVARQLRFHHTDPAVYTPIRAIVIDSGLISIGSVRASDQRKDIIGPALARNPGRLAEVTDLERFVELARRFSIPIELPVGVSEAFVKQASMRTAMSQDADPLANAADPLANVAEEKRPRRRARP